MNNCGLTTKKQTESETIPSSSSHTLIDCGLTTKKQTGSETIDESKVLQNSSYEEILETRRKEWTVENWKHYEKFDLDSFPKDWVEIQTDSDAGKTYWTFLKNNGKYELLWSGGMEDYKYEILNSNKLNDTIFVESKSKDFTNEFRNFKILWNKEKHLIRATDCTQYTGDWYFFVEYEYRYASNYEVYPYNEER
ncbi:hypothetical protein AGMMS4956_15550 [Bacteroidia bacterium]|nr:hypothetical protein AGMMS4956_15550 [Bacteroidia bacterium]